jgi:hypothetical protein
MNRSLFSWLLAGAAFAAAFSLTLPAPAEDAASQPAPAAPARDPREPSRMPVSWELNFKHGTLERITVPVDGKDQTYWFMRYTVINNSGHDVLFTPSFEIVAESGVATPAIKNVPAPVFAKIKSLYNNPLLLSPINIDGKLLQGEDNAKDSIAVFPALDPDSRTFKVFAMGLSGETSEVIDPISKKSVLLQKTLELDYNIPGQAINTTPQPKLLATKWVFK